MLQTTLGFCLEGDIEQLSTERSPGQTNTLQGQLLVVIEEALRLFTSRSLGSLIPLFRPFDAECKQVVVIVKMFHEIATTLLADYKANRRGTALMLEQLLAQVENGTMGESDLRETLFAIFLGGVDTTSTAQENWLQLMCNHPHVLRKVQAELLTVVGPHRLVKVQDMQQLKYFWQVCGWGRSC